MTKLPKPVCLMVLCAGAVLVAGCTSSDAGNSSADAGTASPSAAARPSPSVEPAPASPIVGLWEQTHTCAQLVGALQDNGLAALAPAVVGDYFPDTSPEQLARKGDRICDGAEPQRHAHFFTEAGGFGSVDQNGEQVDDGTYEVVDAHTLLINEGTFTYRIRGGDLVLEPVIGDRDRRAALARPLEFATAGWQVAVTYGGLPFRTAPCSGWC
jgi:hypothetical protein